MIINMPAIRDYLPTMAGVFKRKEFTGCAGPCAWDVPFFFSVFLRFSLPCLHPTNRRYQKGGRHRF
jgi:hypothetical protein